VRDIAIRGVTLSRAGDKEQFRWLVQWLAHIVQRPHKLAGTAVALRGPQGSGKTLVGEVMGAIIGDRLYAKVSRPEELTGRFNAHHDGRLLLQVEEGFWAGDKKAEGVLKDMITSPTRRIERKFMDPIELPNLGRLFITSNNAWVIPAGLGERRFAMFDVSGDRANDLEYFRALRDQMFEEGGCAKLHHYLLHEVVIDWDLIKRPPPTRALLDQQLESLDPEDRWLYDLLAEGTLPHPGADPSFATTDTLYHSYCEFLRGTRGRPKSKARFAQWLGDRLGNAVTPARPRENGSRVRGYQFVSLAECRAQFAQRLTLAPSWAEPVEWEANDALAWCRT